MAVVSHFLDIVRAKTLLRVREPRPTRMFFPQKVRDERVHPGGRKKDRRIVFRQEGCGRDDGVTFFLEKIEVFLADVLDGHSVSSDQS